MRVSRLLLCIASTAIVLPSLAAPPAPAAPVAGAPLQSLLALALSRSPTVRMLEARQDEAAAARDSARTWIAGAPVLGLSQRDERWSGQRTGRESEVSMSAPVWLPGQKSARVAVAARTGEEAAAQLLAARLAVAGQLRSSVWEAAGARATVDEKQDHLHHMEQLADEVDSRVKAGDLARSDALLARQEVAAAEVDVALATTRAAEALARYRVLTGVSDLPQLAPEPLHAPAIAVSARLAAARATALRAQALLRLAEATRAAPPSVALSLRHESARDISEPTRSVAISVQIPLGSASRNRPAETQALTQIATAAAEVEQAEANVAGDIWLAEQKLALAQAGVAAASRRANALHEHRALIEKAFRLGERGLAEVLRSNALTHEADVALRQQHVALGLAHAQLNQARGILP